MTPSVIHVLYATQTGNAEIVAEDTVTALTDAGLSAELAGLDDITLDELAAMERVAVVCSSTGDGEVPDDAELFWKDLTSDEAPSLAAVHYTVCALGDRGYTHFCNAGRMIDERFAALGAARLLDRADCDVDFTATARAWREDLVAALTAPDDGIDGTGTGEPAETAETAADTDAGPPVRERVPAVLAVRRRLTGPGSDKEVHHHELVAHGDLGAYVPGDGIAVVPHNDPALVDALLAAGGADGSDGSDELRETLRRHREIVTPTPRLLDAIAARTDDDALRAALRGADRAGFLWGRDVLDLVGASGVGLDARELVDLLDPLEHRTYSIASSPAVSPDRIALTVSCVRYEGGVGDGRERGGVCSTHLADRLGEGEEAEVFLLPNTLFRLPGDDVAIIMIGPGTGVAPFRAFLQERRARGAPGRNWLFFGDRHRDHDFLYGDELTAMHDDGLLTRLDLAFSRDQDEKVYVQHRMRAHGAELVSWLDDGAHVYVCGDAERMAPAVDAALREIVAEHGGLDEDAAAARLRDLRRERRYLLDVY